MNGRNTNANEYKKTLFSGLNEEKASGLAYTAAIFASFLTTILFFFAASVTGILKDGYQEREWWKYASFLLTQIAFFAAAFFYFKGTKTSVKQTVGKPKFYYYLIAIALQFGLFSISSVNGLFLQWLERFGYTPSEIALPSTDGARIVPVIFVVAVLPACFEELFFRGVLFRGLKKFGGAGAVLTCAALFSLYHQSPAQTWYQFVCGACFALVAWRSGSILPTVLSHFLNNALIIVLDVCGVSGFSLPLLCIFGALLAFSLVWLIFIDKNVDGIPAEPKDEKVRGYREGKNSADVKGFFCYALCGIAVCAISWIGSLASGF